MRCMHDNLKLPKAINLDMIRCVKITMNNGDTYTLKVDDLIAVQFVKDDNQILVRRGRVKDLVVINKRELSTKMDNVSHIILDCSEQFTVKLIEIKFSDIIKIGKIDDEFDDYSDRITELHPDHMKECEHGVKIPIREHGMETKSKCECKPEPSESNEKPVMSHRGFAITK